MVRQTQPELAWLPFDRDGLGAESYAFGLQLVAKLVEVLDNSLLDDRHHVRGVRTHKGRFRLQDKSQAIKDLTTQEALNA